MALRTCLGATLFLVLLGSVTATAAGTPGMVSGNLVRNGGAEVGGAATDSSRVVAPASWKTTEGFTAVSYSAGGGFPDAAAAKAIAGGKHFFAGGPPGDSLRSSASQVDRVPAAYRKDGVAATLSAALGGYSSQLDSASVTATFLGSAGAKLGVLRLGPVSRARRGGQTRLVPVSKKIALPAGTTSIEVAITASAQRGGYKDGYADNLDLRLSA
jgi:hypothetical protein